MLHAAEKLAGLGFALHWLQPKSKKPIEDKWSTLPYLPFKKLNSMSHPANANIGIRLGEPSKINGLYLHAIDLDIRTESYTQEALTALKELFPTCDNWPRVMSGSGGESRHFYFLTDKTFRSKKLRHSVGKFADDAGKKHWHWEIELFGTGKQLAAPPSIHPDTGNPYVWIKEFDADLLEMGLGPVIASDKIPTASEYTNIDDEDDSFLLSLVRTPPLGLNEQEIRDIVFALPVEEWMEDREGWRNTGMAIHHETGGSALGFKIWCDFSERSEKFEMRGQRIAWNSFDDEHNNPITMHSLKKVLKIDGADFSQCQQKLDLCTNYRQALKTASEYEMSHTETNTILEVLVQLAKAEGMNATKGDIKKDLAEAHKAHIKESETRRQKSLEDWIGDEVLRVFYGSGTHLRRFNKSYWFYDQGVWRMLDSEVVANRVYITIATIIKNEDEGGGALQNLLNESGRMDTMNALTNSVASLIEKKSANDGRQDPLGLTKMDVPSIINCTNGELWFDDEGNDYEFIKHTPSHFLTHQIGTAYDPMSDCPEWDRALDKIFGGHPDTQDIIRHLHEIMGYLIQPQRNIACWIMFYGLGSNGKSLVASVLQEILGNNAWVGKSLAEVSRSKNTHLEAGLVGKLLMVDDDYDKGAILPDGMLKKLSEAKGVTANPKNSAEFNFICRATPLLLVNAFPKTKDMSFGLERRAEIFDFNVEIKEHEKDLGLLKRILRDELPGILNRLIEGWSNLKSRGYLVQPESCKRAKRAWMGKRNALSGFVQECIEVTGEETDRVEAQTLWEAFQHWSLMDNSGSKWGRNTFYDEIESLRDVKKYAIGGKKWFKGLKLLHHDFDLDELI